MKKVMIFLVGITLMILIAECVSDMVHPVMQESDDDSSWVLLNASAFTPRNLGVQYNLPNGNIVAAGGYHDGLSESNDTWRSSDGGYTWTQLANAGWSVRKAALSATLQNGHMLLMGGYNQGATYSDVWESVDGGDSWVMVNASAWPARQEASSVVLPNGSILVYGGNLGQVLHNDEWISADEGSTWRQISVINSPSERRMGVMVISPTTHDLILISGIDGRIGLSDVWRSTNSGASWTKVNSNIPFAADALSGATMPDGSIIITGGSTFPAGVRMNAVYRSTDEGTTWTRLSDAPFSPRDCAGYGIDSKGNLMLTGGSVGNAGTGSSEVWILEEP